MVVLNWILLILIVLAASAQISLTLAPLSTGEPEQDNLPTAAVQFIEQNKPAGPLFNSYNWGGYLIYRLWPAYPVYIDGRTDLYEDSFMRRYISVMAADEGWQQTLDEDGINLVLIESNSVLAKFMAEQPAWAELYRDDMAVVYARK